MNKANKKSKIFNLRRLPMDFGRIVCWPCLLFFRIKRYDTNKNTYKKHIKGGVLVAANHIDFGDPFILGTTFWYRRVFFLASKEIMSKGLQNLLLREIGCIKIDRENSDIESIRKAVDTLKSGNMLGIFPQGGLKKAGELGAIKSGSVLIATRAGVPIIPMYSEKRRHWYERRIVVIGEPIVCNEHFSSKLPSLSDIKKISDILLERMEECRKIFNQLQEEKQ